MTDNRTPRTCSSCRYRIEGECRCCPPQIFHYDFHDGYLNTATAYPNVKPETPACAMYQHNRRGGNQPEEAA